MATPKVFTDNSTPLDEANLNKFLNAIKAQVKVNFFGVSFTASDNSVAIISGQDSDGEVVDGDLAWDGTDNEIDITLTGFSSVPIGIVTIRDNNSTNVGDVLFRITDSSTVHLRFIGSSGGETAVDPDGDVQVQVIIIGS